MNTKGDVKTTVTIVLAMIVMLILVGVFFGKNGIFNKATGSTDKLISDNIVTEEGSVDPETGVTKALSDFYRELKEKMLNTQGEKCIITLNKIPASLNNYDLKFSNLGGKTFLRMINKQEQTLYPEELPGIEPCMVDSKKFREIIDGTIQTGTGEIINADELTIKKGNKIILEKSQEDGEYDFIDVPILYKYDAAHVCFFTTDNLGASFGSWGTSEIEYVRNLNSVPLCGGQPLCDQTKNCMDYALSNNHKNYCINDPCNLNCEWLEAGTDEYFNQIYGSDWRNVISQTNKPEIIPQFREGYCIETPEEPFKLTSID